MVYDFCKSSITTFTHPFIQGQNMAIKFDATIPTKLYRYSEKKWLKRSLEYGEFRLRPASDYKAIESDLARNDDELIMQRVTRADSVTILDESGRQIKPIGDVTFTNQIETDYLTLCFAKEWRESFFEDFSNTDSCLVIHNVEEFMNRFYEVIDYSYPKGLAIGNSVEYGKHSVLGVPFSKPIDFKSQCEWRLAWLPDQPLPKLEPVNIQIGNISDIAEIVDRNKLKIDL